MYYKLSRIHVIYDSLFLFQSSRGQDVQLFIVDEANFLPLSCYDGLLPHAQKRGGKLIFTSSSASVPTNGKSKTCNLDVLRKSPGVLFASVTYVCDDHIGDFMDQANRTTCDCFIHLEPFHVDNSVTDRDVAERLNNSTGRDISYLIERGVSYGSLLNRGVRSDQLPLMTASSVSFMLEQGVDTFKNFQELDRDLFVYVDTCVHLSPSSKNGISVCARYINSVRFVLLGVDHCYHVDPHARGEQMPLDVFLPNLILGLVSRVCELHPEDTERSYFTRVYIVIEYNSFGLSTTLQNLKSILKDSKIKWLDGVYFFFLHHISRKEHNLAEEYYSENGKIKGYLVPGFVMSQRKTEYFRLVFEHIRALSVSLSQYLTSISLDPMLGSLHDLVVEQLTNIQVIQKNASTVTYTGKAKGKVQDDLAVSIIMSIYFASQDTDDSQWQYIGTQPELMSY